jgi:hypothetical protein
MGAFSITRRKFLRILGILGIAVPATSLMGCDIRANVYKLSTDGRSACKACRNHAHYKIFKSAEIANSHRAHPGCNCKIKLIRVPREEAGRYFAAFPYYDRRTRG